MLHGLVTSASHASAPSTGLRLSAAPAGRTSSAADQEEIRRAHLAIRLGWTLAELRGRLSERSTDAPATGTRVDHALPLGNERTAHEQAIEAEAVVRGIAGRLEVDFDFKDPNDAKKTVKASDRLTGLALELADARDPDDWNRRWQEVTEFLYRWDARIQDALASTSFLEMSAYQLGRGLGDIAWALVPDVEDPHDPRSWGFLLGHERCGLLRQLMGRTASLFPPLTPRAVNTSLRRWEQVAANPSRRKDAAPVLRQQARVWRDLVLVGRNPESLVGTPTLLKRARSLRPVLKSFWPELAMSGLSIAALAVAGYFLSHHDRYHGVATVLAVLGVFGVTASGLLAKAKDKANDLLRHLRTAMYGQLVDEAATRLPPIPQHAKRNPSD